MQLIWEIRCILFFENDKLKTEFYTNCTLEEQKMSEEVYVLIKIILKWIVLSKLPHCKTLLILFL